MRSLLPSALGEAALGFSAKFGPSRGTQVFWCARTAGSAIHYYCVYCAPCLVVDSSFTMFGQPLFDYASHCLHHGVEDRKRYVAHRKLSVRSGETTALKIVGSSHVPTTAVHLVHTRIVCIVFSGFLSVFAALLPFTFCLCGVWFFSMVYSFAQVRFSTPAFQRHVVVAKPFGAAARAMVESVHILLAFVVGV